MEKNPDVTKKYQICCEMKKTPIASPGFQSPISAENSPATDRALRVRIPLHSYRNLVRATV